MKVTIDKGRLLAAAEAVAPCLSKTETLEQSKCIVFHDALIGTYDGEKACVGPSDMPKEFTAAVDGGRYVGVLRKLVDDTLRVSATKDELRIRGGSRCSAIRFESEVKLPLADIPRPTDDAWTPLPDDFCEAMSRVGAVAGSDDAMFALTCVHVHPDWLESGDRLHVARWDMDLALAEPFLLPKASAIAVSRLGVVEMALTDGWAHFRNGRGYVLSCKRYDDDFPSSVVTQAVYAEGDLIDVPAGMELGLELAKMFAADNLEGDAICFEFSSGKAYMTGQSQVGWHREQLALSWKGPDCCFYAAPSLLKELIKSHAQWHIAHLNGEARFLRVEAGPYRYATVLQVPQPEEAKED